MTAPEKHLDNQDPASSAYGAYGQLVRMLLPSSGCLAIYGVDGELAWCSDGFERPDFRELLDDIRRSERLPAPNLGQLRKTSAGVNALVARLSDPAGATLGYVLLELGDARSAASTSMAVSLTRPLFACLASQRALERPAEPAVPVAPPSDARLEFLLGTAEIDLMSPRAIRELLRRCVDRLDCLSAVFCIPDLDLTEVAERSTRTDDETRARLDATRRHLLAWAQLNNRPMVVNRIDNAKAPYKILSCPVSGRDGKAGGLLALFRAADSQNFELDDVRLIEFVGRQALNLLHERQDALTGLMSRPAFERYLDIQLRQPSRESKGMLLYIDVDDLNAINRTFSYATGDEVIVRAAQLIRRSLAPNEKACRLAGDRFVVYLPERDADGAATLGAEIAKSAVDLGFTARGNRVPLTLCFGVAEPPTAGGSRHWIAVAEQNCRLAGLNGPNAKAGASRSGSNGAGANL